MQTEYSCKFHFIASRQAAIVDTLKKTGTQLDEDRVDYESGAYLTRLEPQPAAAPAVVATQEPAGDHCASPTSSN